MEDINFQNSISSLKVDFANNSKAIDSTQKQKSKSKLQKTELLDRNVSGVIDKVNKFVKSLSTKVLFSVDGRTGKQIITVTEKETGKLIRQIPSKEMLELAAKMKEIGVVIFNKRV